MFKKALSLLLVILFLTTNVGQSYGASNYTIENINDLKIRVQSKDYGNDMRIMIEKDENKYYYSLNNNIEEIPIQLGNGSYTVRILKNSDDNKYKVVEKVNLNIKNNNLDVYLSSSQPVYWENEDKVISLKNNLMQGLKTDKEKIEAVYNYIVKNIKYDYNKINNISTDYVPDLDNIITTKKGICYDYASLFAGILRAEGIHTKLIKGYKNDIKSYHAWNEVLIDGSWVIIDTTYDAALLGAKTQKMAKSSMEYNKVREY